MSDTSYKLLCLIEGERTPFSLVAPSTIFIGQLQQMLREERSIFKRIDASQLALWKVDVDFEAVEDKILRREYRPNQPQSLHTVKAVISQLFEVWPGSPPDGHLHVFINLPDHWQDFTPDISIPQCLYRSPLYSFHRSSLESVDEPEHVDQEPYRRMSIQETYDLLLYLSHNNHPHRSPL